MRDSRRGRHLGGLLRGLAALCTVGSVTLAQPRIPKVWDDAVMAEFELPLANPKVSPKHLPSEYYYRIPVRKIYRTYPMPGPGQNFEEYMNGLRQVEPEVIEIDPGKLSTEDWIRIGKAVFEAPTTIIASAVRPTSFLGRVVIRQKGQLDLGNFSCANCHTRRMSDGSVIAGAQEYFAQGTRLLAPSPEEFARLKAKARRFYATPWLDPDPNATFASDEEFLQLSRVFPGTRTRIGTSLHRPVQIPDLIGIKDRKYLDHTGLVQHRSIADLMRYAATNQGEGDLQAHAHYGDFLPVDELPDPSKLERFSDEQLYALALYLYSLQPLGIKPVFKRGDGTVMPEGSAIPNTPQ